MKRKCTFLFCNLAILMFCQAQTSLPANMYADTLHAPFIYGVASGDPHATSVVLWTKWAESNATDTSTVLWELASDSLFAQIVQTGSTIVDSSSDFTAHFQVNNLTPGTTYYYRFHDWQGNYSVKGRTKTAQSGNVSELKVAVFSCSSIYSGFFNAYRRLGERNDVDVAIHLGDYIYDFVDADEEIRVPTPYPTEPVSLEEYRTRQKYYLLDPDLRFARQQHPWIVIWDNHDLTNNDHDSPGAEAFREYVPIELNANTLAGDIYRDFSFGNLLHIWMADVSTHRNVDTLYDGSPAIMDKQQLQWILSGLKNTNATWKMLGGQKMMGGWYTTGIPQFLLNLVPNDGSVFDSGSWDGFPTSRAMIIDTLRAYNIDNFVAISGDAHVSIAMDMVKKPEDTNEYDAATGAGSAGVEFLPSSISRGNMDEAGVPALLIPTFTNVSNTANPQHVYTEFTSHGYGLLTIREDSILAQFFYSPILAPSNTETLGKSLIVRKGDNHWLRQTASEIETANVGFAVSQPYPNPTNQQLFIAIDNSKNISLSANILTIEGKNILTIPSKSFVGKQTWEIALPEMPEGTYILRISDGKNTIDKMFLKK